MVAIPVGHIDGTASQNWTAMRKKAKRRVLQRLKEFGVIDLEKHIKFEIHFSPGDWQKQFNLTKGASHGLRHSITQMAYLRPHNRHKRYKNLYFVGGSVHPGGGIPLCLAGCKIVDQEIPYS